jgi:hypothetical protein
LTNVRQDIGQLQASLKGGYSKTLDAVVREKETEEEKIANELQEELAKLIKPTARAWRDLPGLVDVISAGGDEARMRLRPVLRQIVEEAWVLIVRRGANQLCAVQFFFVGGAQRSFLILNKLAAYRRPGGWSAHSFASVANHGDIDLREARDVTKVERLLNSLDLQTLK